MITVADIAESITEGLNEAPGGTFSQPFQAVRKYVPAVDLDKLGDALSVLVYPRTDTVETLTRGGKDLHEMVVEIGVQKRLGRGTDPTSEDANPEIDALVTLVREIADYLSPSKIIGDAPITRVAVNPVFAPEHLREKSVFTSVVSVAVKSL